MIRSMVTVRRSFGAVTVVLAVLAWLASSAWAQRFVFVSNDGPPAPTVSVFTVGAGGGLTAVSGSPFATGGACCGADAVVVTPDGRHLYVTNFSGSGSVSGFSVGASGALTPLPGSPWAAGTQPTGLAITPNGEYLYATNGGASSVSAYAVGASGVLTPLGSMSLGAGQDSPGFPAITPNGGLLYVPDTEGVVAFAIAADGLLSPAPGSPYALPGGLAAPAAGVTPRGDELLVGMGYGSGTVAAYRVAASGALTAVTGSPFTAASGLSGVPDLAVSPTGGAVYVDDQTSLAGMSIAADGTLHGLPGNPYSFPDSESQPQSIAVAPGGSEVFADNPGQSILQPYAAQGDGALTAIGSSLSTGGANPDQGGIAVSPDKGPAALFLSAAAPTGSPSSFDASASTAPDSTVARYAWTFGDGMSTTTSTQTTTHVYAAPGTYTVTLTVTNSDGCSTSGPFTGQSPSCPLDPAASTSHTITVSLGTTAHTARFGDQRVTLTTPAGSSCEARGRKLPVSLSEKKTHGTPLKFKRATFFLDKGVKHTRKEKKKIRRHGKTAIETIKVTKYLPNATATRLPATKQLSLAGLKPGTHTLTVKLSYSQTKNAVVKRHGKTVKVKRTITVTKTLKVKFTVC
jgi:hypothetical protein